MYECSKHYKYRNLTQARVKELFYYSPSTGVLYWREPDGSFPTRRAGSACKRSQVMINGKLYLVYRVAWFYCYGTWPKIIDHINRDPTDNRITNLRPATHSQNLSNTVRKPGKTGIRGVTVEKTGKFRASIRHNRKRIEVGKFDTAAEAKAAWDAIAIELRGEFAVLE